MTEHRRSFLRGTGLGAAALLGAGPAEAQTPRAPRRAPPEPARTAEPPRPRVLPRGMTFCTLREPDGGGLGIRTERGILHVRRAEAVLRTGAPMTMTELLRFRRDNTALRELPARAQADREARRFFIPEAEAAFGPCVPEPEKIICVGLNYRAAAEEMGEPVPAEPVLSGKFNNALNHHGGTIAVTGQQTLEFDYGASLVIVIGRTARRVEEAAALSHVFGYCIGQDITARALQRQSSQWLLSKTGDGWGPLGPWLVTADQVDPTDLRIECLVNGDFRQSSNTGNLVHDCRRLVSFASRHITLRPGDLIFTGTPDGVIAGIDPDRRVWLKPGDRIVTRIARLGEQAITMA